jgi:hypothetical protein
MPLFSSGATHSEFAEGANLFLPFNYNICAYSMVSVYKQK